MFEKINTLLVKIKKEKPLILNITNYVTMDFVANGLLSLGASPVMSHATEEIGDLISLANSIVINLGTLDKNFFKLCEHACLIANQLKKSIILDPVGAGASRYRTKMALKLINDYDISIIRGNASEVIALSGLSCVTKGVDSAVQSDQAIESAKMISTHHNITVIVSGEVDQVIEANTVQSFFYGSPLMPMITGSGCLLSAVVGTFHAIQKNKVEASIAATVFYGICGEIASKKTNSPGSFKTEFLNALNLMPIREDYAKK